MKQTLFLLLAIMLALVALASNTAVNRHYDHLERPQSATELIIQSRQTPVASGNRVGAYMAFTGLLALSVAFGLGILAYLKYRAEFFKQWRLAHKKQARRPSYPALREVPNVPRIPTVRDYEDTDYR